MKTIDDKLIEMANQIADFFRPYPADQAVTGIHDHLEAFWTPGMRRQMLARAEAGDPRFDPLVLEAARGFPTAESPIRKQVSGPGEVGQLASDAG